MNSLNTLVTRSSPTPQVERFHAFDALRASMMLLGIYLHAICAYTTVGNVWFFQDSATGTFWDVQALFIHVFRMPVFFVMAGFFSALLVDKRDFAGFLENRVRRIGLPLAVLFFALSAILLPLARFGKLSGQDPLAARKALVMLTSGNWLAPEPMHLWFMVVLLCFVPLSWLLHQLLRGPIGCEVDRWFSGLMQTTTAPLLLAIPTFFSLVTMPFGVLDTPALLPQPNILAAYAVFYVVGWLFYRSRSSLNAMAANAWPWVGAAAVATVAYFNCVIVQLQDLHQHSPMLTASIAAAGAVLTWLMIFALIALSLRYFHRTNPAIRWIADSSYWLYLAHPIALVGFQILWKQAPLPAAAKLVITLVPSLAVLWLSYAILVRDTWLGRLLNGTPNHRVARAPRRSVVAQGSAS